MLMFLKDVFYAFVHTTELIDLMDVFSKSCKWLIFYTLCWKLNVLIYHHHRMPLTLLSVINTTFLELFIKLIKKLGAI